VNADASTVIIIDDTPMQRQVATLMAAEFGSRVQVETTDLHPQSILITGWNFWLQTQAMLAIPKLLVMATLPIPSLEDPRVAGQVAYYKQYRQDWFRLYLLPTALRTLQGAIAPLRRCQGVVALLDNRVLHRSYGQQVLTAISPYARINYVDENLFYPASMSSRNPY
jgi:ATP-dependent DNA helicase DinG